MAASEVSSPMPRVPSRGDSQAPRHHYDVPMWRRSWLGSLSFVVVLGGARSILSSRRPPTSGARMEPEVMAAWVTSAEPGARAAPVA